MQIRFVALLILVGIVCVGGTSQTISTVRSLSPSSISDYGTADGLPVACTFDGVKDRQGKLWVNVCFGLREHGQIDFFHFDGNSSNRPHGFPASDETVGQAYVAGQMASNKLYGAIRRTHKFFTYNPLTGDHQIGELPDRELRITFIGCTSGDSLIVVGVNDREFQIYVITDGTPHLLDSIARNSPEKFQDEWYFADDYVLVKDALWFYDYGSRIQETDPIKLVHYNISSGEQRDYTTKDFVKGDRPVSNLNQMRRIAADRQGNIFLLLGTLHTHFRYNSETDEFVTMPLFSRITEELSRITYINSTIHTDNVGNTLFVRLIKTDYYEAVLRKPDGTYYDYSRVFNAMFQDYAIAPSIKSIIGEDFLSGGIVFSAAGIAAYEMQLGGAITKLGIGVATRAIALRNDSSVVSVVESGFGDNVFELNEPSITGASNRRLAEAYLFSSLEADENGNILYKRLNQNRIGQILPDGSTGEAMDIGRSFQRLKLLGSDSILLISPGELFVYQREEELLSTLPIRGEFKGEQIYNTVRDGSAFLIATSGGLWAYKLSDMTITQLSDQWPDKRIMWISKGPGQTFWAGTFSGGIVVLDSEYEVIQIIDRDAGLSNNTVVGLAMDADGDMWASTFNGLNIIDKNFAIRARIYANDGLSTNEFNRGSFHKDKNGTMYFGSIDGINVINPKSIKSELFSKDSSFVYIETVQKSGQTIKNPSGAIELAADERYLQIEFGLTSLVRPEDHLFEYRIKGSTDFGKPDEWISVGASRELTLMGLPEGRYVLYVRGKDHRGNRSINVVELPIVVAAFFYESTWFYFVLAGVLFALIALWLMRERAKRSELEIIVADRTRRIRTDKELIQKQAEELKTLDKLKTEFFTNISHEFRTPLTVIDGMARRVEQGVDGLSTSGASTIRRNAGRLLELVNQILDLRKLQAGKLRTNVAREDIVAFIRYISESFASLAAVNNVEMKIDCAPDSVLMDFDREVIQRVLSNLLSNAIKYNKPGGSVSLHTERIGSETFVIHVMDTGHGIPQEHVEHIFENFYQVANKESTNVSGTGIGLALTYELVRLIGGSISVESEEGVGSAFRVEIPITQDAPLHDKPLEAEANVLLAARVLDVPNRASNDDPDKPTILIVEDSQDVRDFIAICLNEEYNLLLANHGSEGLDLAIEHVPDIVVTDVMMPFKDGLELTNELKQDLRTSHIPIVMLTAKADIESRLEGLERGADIYLAKPFDERELKLQLRNILEMRAALRKRYGSGSVDKTTARETVEDRFMRKLNEVIGAHLDQDSFGVQDLCLAMSMSRTQLHNKIKSLTGRSTTNYIRLLRLNKAREIMAERPDLTLSEIAYAVGFSGLPYFSRVFTDELGVAPSQFRKSGD